MSPPLDLTPLPSLTYTTHQIPSSTSPSFPNNPLPSPPLIIYHAAYPTNTSPSTIEAHLRLNTLIPQWRYTMYTTSHYHSTTHEILCVFSGHARILFGGEKNPGALEVELRAGDACVVPAGVAHRLVEDVDGGFEMVGAYPKGCAWDMCYADEGEEVLEKIKGVEWLQRDPLYGEDGPVVWGREGGKGEEGWEGKDRGVK